MNLIKTYYEIIHKLNISNFQISFLKNLPEHKQELIKVQNENIQLTKNIDEIKNELSRKTDDADKIRAAYLFIADSTLKSLANIKGRGHFPDLSQGMIIPGYLFGQILTDFKNALKSEGTYHPVVDIYMSLTEWDYEPLQDLLYKINSELSETTFQSKIQAIEYFELISKEALEIVEDLKKKQII